MFLVEEAFKTQFPLVWLTLVGKNIVIIFLPQNNHFGPLFTVYRDKQILHQHQMFRSSTENHFRVEVIIKKQTNKKNPIISVTQIYT